jgi:hypothetical protein
VGRGQVRQVKVSDLDMAQGGVLREDKALRDGSYMTEMLTESERRSVVLPNSRIKGIWDLIIAVLVTWTALMLPIQLCYDDVPATLPEHFVIFDVFVDIVFIMDVRLVPIPRPLGCDHFPPRPCVPCALVPTHTSMYRDSPPQIVLNFHVGYVEDAVVVVDKVSIRRKYMSKWLPIDAVGSFPGDTIFLIVGAATGTVIGSNSTSGDSGGSGDTAILTLFKVLKIPKLMRLGRLFKSLEKLEGAANVANIAILLAVMVVLNHWISCFWFFVTKGEGGWVELNGLNQKQWTEQYPEIFYTTLMIVMGDAIEPATHGEFILSSLIVIIGVTINATVFASIASYASQISADTAVHKNRMMSIQRSIKSLRLPSALSARIQQYYEYCWIRHRDFSAQDLLDDLPAVFQRRCAFMVHEQKLRRFGPFSNADERFVAALTTKLRPEVYMPEAYVLVSGQVYSCAYFVAGGLAQVSWHAAAKDTVNVLTVDDYFGELSLFVNKKLQYTVRAITHLDTFRLDRDDFMMVMRSHPAGAVHVADLMESVLPPKLAKQVCREIYDYSGLRELLVAFRPDGRWRPGKGVADKIRKMAIEQGTALEKLRKQHRVDHRNRRSMTVSSNRKSMQGGQSFTDRSSPAPATSAPDSTMRRELNELLDAHSQLAQRVEANQTKLEQKLDQLMSQLSSASIKAQI